MDREIKFRAWDKQRKEYLSGGQILISIEPGKSPAHSHYYLDVLKDPDMYCERFIIEQFTGLTDKNGKEIFEGQYLYVPYNRIGFVKVKFEDGCFNISAYKLSECTIHDSPELISQKQKVEDKADGS